MAWNIKAECMKIYTSSETQLAQDHSPQIERFIYNGSIYIVEYLSDYDMLPADVIAWRELIAYSG